MKVYVNGRLLEVDEVVLTKEEFTEAVTRLPSGSTILWDEVSVGADARRIALLHETRRRLLRRLLDDAIEESRLRGRTNESV